MTSRWKAKSQSTWTQKNSKRSTIISKTMKEKVHVIFFNFALPHSSTNPCEIRAAASSFPSSFFYFEFLNTQLLVINICAIVVLKNARNLRLPCFSQTKRLFFANFWCFNFWVFFIYRSDTCLFIWNILFAM